MAVLHRKEEKIQAVLGRLPKKYTQEQFIEMFIKLYSKDWGKIKSAYIKQSQDREPGTIINMPKPEFYLKQILTNYLQQVDEIKTEVKVTAVPIEVVVAKKTKATVKATEVEEAKPKKATAKKEEKTEDVLKAPEKTKVVAKKVEKKTENVTEEPVKIKAVAKKKVEKPETVAEKPVKVKAVAMKKEEATEEKPKVTRKTAVKK